MKENIILDEKAKETFSTGISYYIRIWNGNARKKQVCQRHQWRLELVLIQLELSKV